MAVSTPLRSMVVPYDNSVFNSIPSLEEAHKSVHTNPNLKAFLEEYELIAAQFSQNDLFGVTLVHRHVNVSPGERMLDLKQTLQPFPLPDDAQAVHGCPIRAKSYALVDGLWMPYEYEFGKSGQLQDSEAFFLDCVRHRIEDLGLQNLGLRRYLPSDPEELEVTENGGVSIKIPWLLVDGEPLDYKTTFWAFPSGAPKTYRCACTDTGSATNPNHNHIDRN